MQSGGKSQQADAKRDYHGSFPSDIVLSCGRSFLFAFIVVLDELFCFPFVVVLEPFPLL